MNERTRPDVPFTQRYDTAPLKTSFEGPGAPLRCPTHPSPTPYPTPLLCRQHHSRGTRTHHRHHPAPSPTTQYLPLPPLLMKRGRRHPITPKNNQNRPFSTKTTQNRSFQIFSTGRTMPTLSQPHPYIPSTLHEIFPASSPPRRTRFLHYDTDAAARGIGKPTNVETAAHTHPRLGKPPFPSV
jgi:hypothetical protein